MKQLFGAQEQPPKHLAYVEWFKLAESKPHKSHNLYRIRRDLNAAGERLASIIPVDAIRRSVHLFPQFGSIAPREWQSHNVLELCSHFFINSYSDRHSYHTIV